MIKCPECGGEISDKADRCVHCGCNIVVCPECGQAVANSEFCPNCGMKLAPAPRTNEQEQLQTENAFQTADNVQKLWESENSAGKIVAKVLKYGGLVFHIISVIVLVFGAISLSEWVAGAKSPDGATGAIFGVGDLRDKLHTMIVCLAVLETLSHLSGIVEKCFLPYQYSLWFTRRHIAAKDLLKGRDELDANVMTNKDAKSFTGQETMKKGLFWAENSREKTKELVFRAIIALLAVLGEIFVAIVLQENLDAYLSSVLISGKFEFQYINLIVAVVIGIAAGVIELVVDSATDKKIKKWSESFKEKQL